MQVCEITHVCAVVARIFRNFEFDFGNRSLLEEAVSVDTVEWKSAVDQRSSGSLSTDLGSSGIGIGCKGSFRDLRDANRS